MFFLKNAECRQECNGAKICRNPDLIDLWVTQSDCPIICDKVCKIKANYITAIKFIPI